MPRIVKQAKVGLSKEDKLKMKQEVIDQVKDEIGGAGNDVISGNIEYNGKKISYSYAGTKPDDDIILKLLECGIWFENNLLTLEEISFYLNMEVFSIHFYYSEAEIYITNANKDYLNFEKVGIGTFKLYSNGEYKLNYYIKSNKKMNSIEHVTKNQFQDMPKQEGTLYVVEDEEYTPNIIIDVNYDGSSVSISDDELKKLINYPQDRLLLKMNYTNTEDTQYELLKLKHYTNNSLNRIYKFENSQHCIKIEINITNETIDLIDLFIQELPCSRLNTDNINYIKSLNENLKPQTFIFDGFRLEILANGITNDEFNKSYLLLITNNSTQNAHFQIIHRRLTSITQPESIEEIVLDVEIPIGVHLFSISSKNNSDNTTTITYNIDGVINTYKINWSTLTMTYELYIKRVENDTNVDFIVLGV